MNAEEYHQQLANIPRYTATFFDKDANQIGETVSIIHVPEARQRGREQGAVGIRIFIGHKDGEDRYHYLVQLFPGRKYTLVNESGFESFMRRKAEKVSRQERIQFMRAYMDPAKRGEEDAEEGNAQAAADGENETSSGPDTGQPDGPEDVGRGAEVGRSEVPA